MAIVSRMTRARVSEWALMSSGPSSTRTLERWIKLWIVRKPFLKAAGHHICDDSWNTPSAPIITSQGSPNIQKYRKLVLDDSWIEPGSIKNLLKNVPKIIRHPVKNNLSLPSELPQVTPETPTDHHKMTKMLQIPYGLRFLLDLNCGFSRFVLTFFIIY